MFLCLSLCLSSSLTVTAVHKQYTVSTSGLMHPDPNPGWMQVMISHVKFYSTDRFWNKDASLKEMWKYNKGKDEVLRPFNSSS